MSNYLYIPVIAMGCYLFLAIVFVAAKKSKIINSFLFMLLIFLLWTGGSFFMRIQMWPSIKFWFDTSLWGLALLPYGFYNFVYAFIGEENQKRGKLWLVICIIIGVVNSITGFMIPSPELVYGVSGTPSFVYDLSWGVLIIFIATIAIVLDTSITLIKYYKKDIFAKQQFLPILAGVICLFIGHITVLFPLFRGFPIDILSGIFNALFMFYALYRKKIFKLTLLVSRAVIYAISVVLSIVLFANFIQPFEAILLKNFGILEDQHMLVVALIFTMATMLLSVIIRSFIDILFKNDEMQQAENLKEFSHTVSQSLRIAEIMDEMISVVHKSIEVDRVYICTHDLEDGNFKIVHSSSPLDGQMLKIGAENPAILWLVKNNKCMLMHDFQRSVYYKSMWEQEKEQLEKLKIECIAPLMDGTELVGIILLSNKFRGKSYSYDDLSLLESVNSIGSIAVKNSKLYEKAYMEARTDELTGLLNRKYFYECLQSECERCRSHSLALMILNLDDFKLYNQLYGNKEGDLALKSVARILKASVGSNGYVARYSGKEFAIILPMYDILSAKNLAEVIRQQIMNMNKRSIEYAMKVLTVSCGIAAIPYSASNMTQLIENADMAVYNVKRRGKNSILAYESEQYTASPDPNADINKEDVYLEYASTIYALTAAIDAKDHYTFSHSTNVAEYAVALAKASGMNSDFVEIVREAGLLHDIGKIGIPETILNKPSRLTTEEFNIMKGHVEGSISIIRNLPSLDYVIPAVIAHHERWDGHGYPRSIKGTDIPLSARMLCIADAFDAMVSTRAYKQPYTVEYALDEVNNQAGLQFDPELAEIFVKMVRENQMVVHL